MESTETITTDTLEPVNETTIELNTPILLDNNVTSEQKIQSPQLTLNASHVETDSPDDAVEDIVDQDLSDVCASNQDEDHQDVQRIAMLIYLASSDEAHFKHQTRNEPDLTMEEKMIIAGDILDKNPIVFLSRFWKFLRFPEDVSYFDRHLPNYEIEFYLGEMKRLNFTSLTKQVQNRRYKTMLKLEEEGSYFSHEEVRHRDPLLYQEMIGRFDTPDEERDKMGRHYESFSGFLMSTALKIEDTAHMKAKQIDQLVNSVEESMQMNEDEESECDDDTDSIESQTRVKDVDKTEREMLEKDFMGIMKTRFLEGKDEEFDYSQVDNDLELDDFEEMDRDLEEKYFDSEDF